MFNTSEKKERALGVRLFLKANRCNSAKCAAVRRPQKPGIHGKSRRRGISEYGQLLNEKQKIRFSYGLRESQLRKVFETASRNPGVTGDMMMQLLERRLDNVVFRLGFAPSRSVARQLVSHGHILVNNKKVTIPSYLLRIGEKIVIRPQSKDNPVFKDLNITLKKSEPPVWLNMDTEKYEGRVVALPKDFDLPFDVNMVVDYYSKQ
ncbi:MAG: small subunit ribosomal protein S4 [Parcubacteria group bacterium Athens0714_26]|nr:MAG: small subunit ribosomal protein S4 [Parcubacteria group bacterium Athens1014_26]TSD03528.1 MAG: small subunit ribosomal protein S4 [Parcubacteria group bacterium Athens0714_26]